MADDYVSVSTIKNLLNLELSDTTADGAITRAIAAATEFINDTTGRRFHLDPVASARTYKPNGRVMCDDDGEHLVVDDIGHLEGLLVDVGRAGSWSPVTDFETTPDNALARGKPITALTRTAGTWTVGATSRVRVTARWGWPAVPAKVAMATQIQAMRLVRRKDSPEGVAGSAEWGVLRLTRLDPDVQALLQDPVLPGLG